MMDWARYLISLRSGITHVIYHNYAKIGIDSFDSLLLEEKTLTLCIAIILIKFIFDKDKNNCYYNIFLEKRSYQLAKK